MRNKILVLGDTEEVLDYNLNKDYISVKKIIITANYLFNNFEEKSEIKKLFRKSFNEIKKEEIIDLLGYKINNNLYNEIQDSLKYISSNLLNIETQELGFINSLSASKVNIRLKNKFLSITEYFVDKAEILGKIKRLLETYLRFKGNLINSNYLYQFQIEIFESEEIVKHILLKKENESFILSSSYGFPKSNYIIDDEINPEVYISKGKEYQLFNTTQNYMWFREHSKITKENIKPTKILSSEDLRQIYEMTENLKDLEIEMFINDKNKLKILNIGLLEENINEFSENGFYLTKSKNDIEKISIINLNDAFDIEYPYPKYLLIENTFEMERFFNEFDKYFQPSNKNIEGIILNDNSNLPFFYKLGERYDIDIIFYKNKLKKSNETLIHNPLSISISNNNELINPFSNIIDNKDEDEMLKRLKKLNLEINKEINQIKNSDSNLNQNQANNDIIKEQEFAKNFLFKKNNDEITEDNNEEENGSNAISFFMNKALKQQQTENKGEEQQKKENKEENRTNLSKEYNKQLISEKINDYELETKKNKILTEDHKKNLEKLNEMLFNRYDNIVAIDIVGPENLTNCDKYFVNDYKNYDKESFMLVSNADLIKKDYKINYVMPITNSNEDNENYYLINSPEDIFLINGKGKGYFVNLNNINNKILTNFIKQLYNIIKNKEIYLIMKKEDIEKINNIIDFIKGIYFNNLVIENEVDNLREKILKIEKKVLKDKINEIHSKISSVK